jgi:hypothetical protein
VRDLEAPYKYLGIHRGQSGSDKNLNQFLGATHPTIMFYAMKRLLPSWVAFDWGGLKKPLRSNILTTLVKYCKAIGRTFEKQKEGKEVQADVAHYLVGEKERAQGIQQTLAGS